MTRSLAAVMILAAGWSFGDLDLERLRWNPRERTAVGIEALESGETERGPRAFETAARLEPGDPLLRFNAGTAHLIAGSDGAMEHLEVAAETAPEWLRPAASYNLGNAFLAAGDPAGAIAAYENTLRSDPGHEDAKFNLELALQQQQQQQEEQQQEGEPSDDESDKTDQTDQPPSNDDDEQQQDSQQPEQQPGEAEQQEGEGEQDQQLPQFEDQPDMTAEQAAAILEAVENLEREQRRKQAEEEMKKRPSKGKDW